MNQPDVLQQRILLLLEAGSPRPVSESLILRIVSDVEVSVTRAGLRAKLKAMAKSEFVEATGEKRNLWQLPAGYMPTKHAAAVDAAISAALVEGRITPATVAYHRASCATIAGLTRFRAFLAFTYGPIHSTEDFSADAPQLNAEEHAVCLATGVTHRQFAAARGER